MIDSIFLATVLCAALAGYVGGRLHKQKRQQRSHWPNGSALQQQPEAVWARWDAALGRAVGRK